MFKKLGHYKPDIHKAFAILGKGHDDAFHGRGGNVALIAYIPENAALELDLAQYNFETDIERYADDMCLALAASFEARKEIDDVSIPTISPMLGIGDYSAFVVGDIAFQPDTSWSKPSLTELRGYKELPELGSSKWYVKFLTICEELLKRSADSGIPFLRGFFSPLDLANALRGDQLYLDFYDDPEGVHGLLDYCATAIITFAEDIYALARKYLADTQYGMWWLEGKIHMSEDIACLVSPRTYREFAAPHTQRVIDHFGRGYMHSHSRAMYLVKEICSLGHVVNLWLATDPNQPRPIEHVEELVKDANATLVAIDCDRFEEIEENFEEVQKGNFSVAVPVRDVQQGIELVGRFERLSD